MLTPQNCRWVGCCAGGGLGLSDLQRAALISHMEVSQLERFYTAWNHWIFGQMFLSRRNNAENIMAATLPKLSGLIGIRCGTIKKEHAHYSHTRDISFESINPIAREILCEPDKENGFLQGQLHFADLFKMSCQSGYALQLSELSMSGVPLNFWDHEVASYLDHYKSFPALKALSLEFSYSHAVDNRTSTLFGMISRSPSIQSLRLSFTQLDVKNSRLNVQIPTVINKARYWEHLRELSLQAVMTTEDYLRDILSKHANTLRSLELSNIDFANPSGENSPQGSWINFFEFLNQSMALEHARFEGTFSNGYDEAWSSFSHPDDSLETVDLPHNYKRDPQLRHPPDCLKYRIERFVTREGPFPFVRIVNFDQDNDHVGIWEVNSDASWAFEHTLLF